MVKNRCAVVGTIGRAAILFVAIAGLGRLCWAQNAGLVAHYTFEEGPGGLVKDSSGNGNDGKIVGDATYIKQGNGKGYALSFNSGQACVDCGNKPSLDLTKALTLSAWFYPQTMVTQGEGGVVGKVSGYCMSYSGRCFAYMSGGSNFAATAALSLAWHHVAATFDGINIKVYVDGKLQSTVKSKVAELPHGANFYLRYPATYLTVEPEYKCMLDDVRVYNRALSDQEIFQCYEEEAKASAKHDVTGFDKPKLVVHPFAQSGTVVAEADYSQMNLQSPQCKVVFELRDTVTGKVAARQEAPAKVAAQGAKDGIRAIRLEFEDLEQLGVTKWTFDVAAQPAGKYEVRAAITGADGKEIGLPSGVPVTLPLEKPDWIKAYDGAKILNNLVTELLNVPGPSTDAQKEYTFTNPRNGWIFISSTAQATGKDRVLLSIDSPAEADAAIIHAVGKAGTLEAMRYLPAGPHKLTVRCEGAVRPAALIIRAIPEMMVAGLGYHHVPLLACYGHYNVEYLQRIGLLDNLNLLIEENPVPENAVHVKAWRQQGKKLLAHYSIWTIWKEGLKADGIYKAFTECPGFASSEYDGMIGDEFSSVGHGGAGSYPWYSEALERIAGDPKYKGKVFYPYCAPMYAADTAVDLLKTVVRLGFKWAEEKYLGEQRTEEAARTYMDLRLRDNVLSYENIFPGAARHMITTLGFMSIPPETLNNYPSVDFKVYMDMQMHLLATDPVFFALYGIHWYHNGYVDEEDLRWTAKLFRHYGIEGSKERLTTDPYILSHIQNPDFDEGETGWTLQPAEEGSISVAHAEGLGMLETRTPCSSALPGDNFLLTQRSAKAPNRFAQKIRNLTVGRSYSLKMFTADYDEMKQGKSTQNPHRVNIRIEGAEVDAEKGFHQLFASGMAGHVYGPFKEGNHLYITYHRVVFRATKPEAMVTVSDWAADDAPGGPIGQRLMHNFVEIQPYFDDPAYPYVAP